MVCIEGTYILSVTFIFYKERFYLVFWEEENTASVLSDEDLKEPSREDRNVGASCVVPIKKKLYTGQIACVGMYACFSLLPACVASNFKSL